MDVIALDRAGIAEVVAPNGTALTEGPARAAVAARSLADPLLRRRQRRAGRPRSAPRPAPCPCSAPTAPCASSSCPPARTPTTSISAGGREAFEALLASPEPLDARLWRHELEAEPLTTPEAWAGLKQRLIAHAAAIGHADLARIYREDWLEPLLRAAPPRRRASPRRSRRSAARQLQERPLRAPPAPPVGADARAIAAAGIDAPTARALILGFANFPEELPAHCEQLAALPIADKPHRAAARRAGQRRLLRRRA